MNVFSSTVGEKAEALAELAAELVVNPRTLVDSDGVESLVLVRNSIDQGNLLRSLKIEVYFPARGMWRSGSITACLSREDLERKWCIQWDDNDAWPKQLRLASKIPPAEFGGYGPRAASRAIALWGGWVTSELDPHAASLSSLHSPRLPPAGPSTGDGSSWSRRRRP